MKCIRTITIDVDVDLEDFDTQELIEEIESREDADDYLGSRFLALLGSPSVLAWLRNSSPPQEVRDWYYGAKGSIL